MSSTVPCDRYIHVNMSYLTRLVLVLPALFVCCRGNTCVDKLPDCAEYTKSSCQGPYVTWAYQNCPAFCGFCHKECEDKRGDCHEFGAGMCQEPYRTWARENCAQYCGFCGTELECLYTPWVDISPCTRTCGGGFKVQVRAFSLVSKGTPLAKDCDKDLHRNKTCNLNACPTPKPSHVVEKVPEASVVDATTKTPVDVPVDVPVVDTGHEHGPLIDVDPVDVATGVAAAGTAVVGGLALSTLLEILPVFAFLGKRDIHEEQKTFDDIVKSVLENQISN